jgi:hypothetical protein
MVFVIDTKLASWRAEKMIQYRQALEYWTSHTNLQTYKGFSDYDSFLDTDHSTTYESMAFKAVFGTEIIRLTEDELHIMCTGNSLSDDDGDCVGTGDKVDEVDEGNESNGDEGNGAADDD